MTGIAVQERVLTAQLLRVIGATFLYFTAVGATMPVLPLFVEGPLQAGDVAVGVVVGAFAITALFARPLAGRWADLRGRKTIIVTGALVVAVSTVALVAASTAVSATMLRLVTGVGEALFFVGVLAAVVDISPEARRGEAMSYFSLGIWAGIAVGPVLGELILAGDRFALVWIATAALTAVAGLVGLTVPESPPEPHTHSQPLFYRGAIRPGVILLASIWGLAGFTAFVPLHALDLGMTGSGTIFLVYGVIMVAIRSAGARIPDRLGPERATRIALTASAAGLLMMALLPTATGLFAGVSVFAIGQALAFPSIVVMAVKQAPADRRGAAVGTVSAALDVAFGLGGLTLGILADLGGYSSVFAISALVAVAGLLLLRRPRPA